MEFKHIPVMYKECIEMLNIKPDGTYLDGTLGGAGHSLGIAERLTNGRLIVNDLDETAIQNGKEILKQHLQKVTFVHDDYKNILTHLDELEIDKIDGVLLDLGVSSYQIDTPERGFSYMKDAPLDMRMDVGQEVSAYTVVNEYKQENLLRLLYTYGEESNAKRIVGNILEARKLKPIATTLELANIVEKSYPRGYRQAVGGHPAKKTFQAIRIEVNKELEGLKEFLTELALRLRVGGRMVIITFHSLEDRIVKHVFKDLEIDCICDKKCPVCICNKRKECEILTKKPILPSEKEIEENRRAKSAKLRIIERT